MTQEMTLEQYWRQRRPRRHKYNAQAVVIDGIRFPSKAEGRRYRELKLLRASGDIVGLRVHPRYRLQDAFTDATGKRWRAIWYEADFEYQEDGRTVVEDVKGAETQVFRLKRKLFLYAFREYELRVVA